MTTNEITSRQNVRVKEAVKLRSARQRQRQGRFLIDGLREIGRALEAPSDLGMKFLEAFICPALCRSDEAQGVADRLRTTDAVVADVTPDVFEKLCFGERTDGVVVVAAMPARRLDQLRLPPQPRVAVLEGLEKPGNVGAILRSADGAGIDAVLVADGRTDLMNPNTIRASLGTVFGPHVCETTTVEAISWLRTQKLPLFAARPEATLLYSEADFRGGGAIVLGSEATGISEPWQVEDVTGIRLPMCGSTDSLNVSATAAVLFYEALRQRGGEPPV